VSPGENSSHRYVTSCPTPCGRADDRKVCGDRAIYPIGRKSSLNYTHPSVFLSCHGITERVSLGQLIRSRVSYHSGFRRGRRLSSDERRNFDWTIVIRVYNGKNQLIEN
jgi:hypothetical protein